MLNHERLAGSSILLLRQQRERGVQFQRVFGYFPERAGAEVVGLELGAHAGVWLVVLGAVAELRFDEGPTLLGALMQSYGGGTNGLGVGRIVFGAVEVDERVEAAAVHGVSKLDGCPEDSPSGRRIRGDDQDGGLTMDCIAGTVFQLRRT